MRPFAWSLALLLASLPTAHAGSPQDPEVADPPGDAGPVAMPAGLEWADLTAVWFEEVDADTVRLGIQVVRLDGDPPGEVGAHFRVGTTWWIAGWTTIAFPAAPFLYQGGFSCVAEADGMVPDHDLCGSLEATHDGTAFQVDLPRDVLGLAPGAAIEEPRGYSVDVVSAQPGLGQHWVDETAVGRAFVLAGPTSRAAARDGAATTAEDGLASPSVPAGPAEPSGSAEAPAAPWGLLGMALVVLAARRR